MPSEKRRIQPRKRPRQVRAELTRERILDAAARVFAEHGYGAGTTNRIAEEAWLSIGSLYQYYPNKDAILAELFARHLSAGVVAVGRYQEAPLPTSLEATVRLFVHTTIETHRDDPRLLRVMTEQARRSPELREKMARHQQELVRHTQQMLDTHPEAGVADTEAAARLVVSTVELVVHQLIAEPGSVEVGRFEDELVAMLTRYLRGMTRCRMPPRGDAEWGGPLHRVM
ncbi:TetR/AcrR family transcriptional regulator [Amycolatopsis jejuensis]|uniref:TetR/AcrR family transcriptional regulator n=1 Tax=Amycolatopsis jejuensis TaxID=330084 RepID=UPI0007C4D58F|nr:TetR/AcrR family transcriptional regulator [Amycolatopsis jejuensis]